MNSMELKYGCNPNQKPARVYMKDGQDLPFTVLNGKPGYINLLDALIAGNWFVNCVKLQVYQQQLHLNM